MGSGLKRDFGWFEGEGGLRLCGFRSRWSFDDGTLGKEELQVGAWRWRQSWEAELGFVGWTEGC